MEAQKSQAILRHNVDQVREPLDKHQLGEHMVRTQAQRRHELVESPIRRQHVADVAYILDATPPAERRLVWEPRSGDVMPAGLRLQQNFHNTAYGMRRAAAHRGNGDAQRFTPSRLTTGADPSTSALCTTPRGTAAQSPASNTTDAPAMVKRKRPETTASSLSTS